MSSPIVLHLPHASTLIPEDLRNDFLLSDQELFGELARITDHATDVIFQQAFPEAKAIVFPVSRLVVDPERFSDDSQEPMSQVGASQVSFSQVGVFQVGAFQDGVSQFGVSQIGVLQITTYT